MIRGQLVVQRPVLVHVLETPAAAVLYGDYVVAAASGLVAAVVAAAVAAGHDHD